MALASGDKRLLGVRVGLGEALQRLQLLDPEPAVPEHVIDTPPQTVYLSGEEQEVIHVRFGNSAKGSLLVKKVSDSDGAPLSEVSMTWSPSLDNSSMI